MIIYRLVWSLKFQAERNTQSDYRNSLIQWNSFVLFHYYSLFDIIWIAIYLRRILYASSKPVSGFCWIRWSLFSRLRSSLSLAQSSVSRAWSAFSPSTWGKAKSTNTTQYSFDLALTVLLLRSCCFLDFLDLQRVIFHKKKLHFVVSQLPLCFTYHDWHVVHSLQYLYLFI